MVTRVHIWCLNSPPNTGLPHHYTAVGHNKRAVICTLTIAPLKNVLAVVPTRNQLDPTMQGLSPEDGLAGAMCTSPCMHCQLRSFSACQRGRRFSVHAATPLQLYRSPLIYPSSDLHWAIQGEVAAKDKPSAAPYF